MSPVTLPGAVSSLIAVRYVNLAELLLIALSNCCAEQSEGT